MQKENDVCGGGLTYLDEAVDDEAMLEESEMSRFGRKEGAAFDQMSELRLETVGVDSVETLFRAG
jgi:hypothetical protein